jgi:type I protein arginine methyltransferase
MPPRRSVKERLLDIPSTLRDNLEQSDRGQRLIYQVRNRRLFADLYQHDRMLADSARVEAYWEALSKHVGPGDVVLDLGSGTGVLSFFAAKQGAQVHGIEHSPLVDAARAVAADNGIENVEFHRVHSSRLELDVQADAIVHEQIGDALFDERMVENIAELRDRFLKPGGRVLPNLVDLYIEPVQLREDLRAPFAWQQQLHGVDFRALEQFGEMSHAYLYKSLRPFPHGKFLCAPEPVFSLDLETAKAGELPQRIAYRRPVTTAGHFDGFCVYFDARFDAETGFGSSPELATTNWANPLLRVRSRPVEVGETIELELTAEDLAAPASWRWNAE